LRSSKRFCARGGPDLGSVFREKSGNSPPLKSRKFKSRQVGHRLRLDSAHYIIGSLRTTKFGRPVAASTEIDLLDRQVRDALAHLHDLPYLQTHPLAEKIGPSPTPAHMGVWLHERLLKAIEALRPDTRVTASSRARRTYDLLSLRYAQDLDPT